MSDKIFKKVHASTDEQLNVLHQRGLLINRPDLAKHYLSTVSYYRLSGYFKPFQYAQDESHQFKPGTTFEQIWAVYIFDRELRLVVSDAIERIEIALRTSLSNVLAPKYGNLWYLSKEPFGKWWLIINKYTSMTPAQHFKNEVDTICRAKKEDFIQHYYNKYAEPSYPPSWMLLECLSFGKCTSLFRHLSKSIDKKAVSCVFNYHQRVIESCLEPLRYTRNVCAHHARLWNRWFVYVPKHIHAFGNIPTKPRSFHEQIVMIGKLHQEISPLSSWRERLYDLFTQYEESVPFHLMGFKEPWNTDAFWDA